MVPETASPSRPYRVAANCRSLIAVEVLVVVRYEKSAEVSLGAVHGQVGGKTEKRLGVMLQTPDSPVARTA